MKEILNIIIIVLLSAAAGGMVSLPVSLFEQNDLLSGFLRGAGAGAVIGFAARWAFSSLYMHFRHRPLPAYLAMTGTVGIGTALGCLLMDIKILPTGIIIIICSILVGIIMTRIILHYFARLNDRLTQKKQSLLDNQ